MYLNDPTLYGATLPQREFPFTSPFMANYVAPWQWQQNQLPFQQAQRYFPQTFQHGMPPFYSQVHGQFPVDVAQREIPFTQPFMGSYFTPWQWQQNMLPFQHAQRFIPPYFPQAFGGAQNFTFPFFPTATNPYVTTGIQNMPFYGWQKGLTY